MDVAATGDLVTIHIQTVWLVALIVGIVLLAFLRKR